MEQLEFTATENEAGVRIDRCLSDKYEELSRSYLQKLLKEQGVTCLLYTSPSPRDRG